VPDAGTADQFIEDKLGQGDFVHHETRSSAFLVNASAWALGMSARVIQPGETPQGTIGVWQNVSASGGARADTAGDAADGQPFRARRDHRSRARAGAHRLMRRAILRHARRRAPHRRRRRALFQFLRQRDRSHRPRADDRALPDRPGISVKLSALHPRFEAVSRQRVMNELVPRLIDLARRAMAFDLNFTVDAEEADRLELSLEVIAAAFATHVQGLGRFWLAIQAYQKRAQAVIGTATTGRALNRRMMVRLVKGAYWDTEIKRAQERGLDDYPVFTRKAMTDLNYIACAQQLLSLRPRIFPQFATHNALTVATVWSLRRDRRLRVSAPARHGRGAVPATERGPSRPCLPHLCTGRQPSRSAGVSGAAPAGERRQFLVRGGRRRR
jgi:RHH-type proline utilization regulon transcriptional repressor/proline dehydrogenase/delta 1-pyrroline-5-carboxylate dehydrogenase